MPDNNRKDGWDKASVIAQFLIPVVLGFGTCTLNKTLQQNEIKAKNLEIAVSILRTEPNDKTRAMREWALKVFLDSSAIKPSKKAIEELKISILPRYVFLTDSNGERLDDSQGNPLTDGAHSFLDGIED